MARILVVGAPSLLTLAQQVAIAFKRDGHTVRFFNYRALNLQHWPLTNRFLNKWLIHTAKRFKPDLLFVVKGESILPGTITAIKQLGVTTADWIIDEPTGVYYPAGKITNIPEYDYLFSFDNSYVPLIKKLGGKHVTFLPISVEETYFKERIPLAKRQYTSDVCFIGTYWPERATLFKLIADKNLHIYGPHWSEKLAPDDSLRPHLRRKQIKGDAACAYFNLTKINLNQTHQQAVDGGINLRIPEVIATRSFLLTNELKGLEKIFVPGKHLVTYTTPADFKRKIEYYLSHPDERDKIANAGYEHFLKHQTLRHRTREILSITKTK